MKRKAPALFFVLPAAVAFALLTPLPRPQGATDSTHPQPTPQKNEAANHVLFLAGNGAFAELPVQPFRNLTNATIECWVRWNELGGVRRVFNYGSPTWDVSILSTDNDTLAFVVADEKRRLNWWRVPRILREGEWYHIAAVIGDGEMQVYVNGFPLRPPAKCTGSFATADPNGRCYLGRSVTEHDSEQTFAGTIDELRVWNSARPPEAIRQDMFRKPALDEPGLAWFADFEPGEGQPPNQTPGVQLHAGAKLIQENLPSPGELQQSPPRFGRRMGPSGPGEFGPPPGPRWRGRSPPLGFLTGLLCAFCVMHALLFAFQPAARNHLYFALISGLAAGTTWPGSERTGIGIHWLALLAALTLRLFQSLFEPDPNGNGETNIITQTGLLKQIFAGKQRRFRGMVAVALVVCAVSVIHTEVISLGILVELARFVAVVLLVIAAVNILRIAWRSFRQKRAGARLIGLGLGALLVLSEISAPIPRIGGLTFGQLGVVIFFCAMSIHLAKTFAIANRQLAMQALELNESNQRLLKANEEIEKQKRDLAQAKAAAEAANEAKSKFLASVSHELRTPLNAIIGYSEMLQEMAAEQGHHQYLSDLQKIHAAAKHQLTLINDILDLAKVEAGKMTVAVEEFDIAQLVNDVVATVRPLVAKGQATLSVCCEQGIGRMCSDPTKVRQILFNLLSNAAKFTPRGQITVRVNRHSLQVHAKGANDLAKPVNLANQSAPTHTSATHDQLTTPSSKPENDWIVFEVSDTGIGMTPEQIKNLFQPFSQVDYATARKHGGTGLGLALVKRFCDLLGGDVVVQSAPSVGSTFTVRLPIQLRPCPEEGPSDHLAPMPQGTLDRISKPYDRPLALVIDDDPAARDLLERALQREGFDVITAKSGTEGLRVLEQVRPAVVTLDVLMPQPDGWAVLSQIKSNPATANIPVVMVTVVDQQSLGFALGADDYITKPVDRERLKHVMARFHSQTQQRRVLIAEDDASTREWLRRALQTDGWFVIEAENGLAAVEQTLAQRPDLVLLDLLMPEMDGFEFLDVIRSKLGNARPPVIVLTAKDLTDEERKSLNCCVNRILEKGGLSHTELIRQIRSILWPDTKGPAQPTQTTTDKSGKT